MNSFFQQQTITKIILLCFFLSQFVLLKAQSVEKIPGTDLHLKMTSAYSIPENTPSILNDEHSITFIEMAGINFFEQRGDFDNIETDYKAKGIEVLEKREGKLGQYDAIFITLKTALPTYQIFFGSQAFCAIANVAGNSESVVLDPVKINTLLSTIEYRKSTISALEEHGRFTLDEKNTEWKYISYVSSAFGFEHTPTGDGAMVLQLPAGTLAMASKKDLAEEFKNKIISKINIGKVIQEGDWKINELEGYRILLDLTEEGSEHLGLVYLYVFGNNESVIVFQGMGKNNDEATQKVMTDFISSMRIKN